MLLHHQLPKCKDSVKLFLGLCWRCYSPVYCRRMYSQCWMLALRSFHQDSMQVYAIAERHLSGLKKNQVFHVWDAINRNDICIQEWPVNIVVLLCHLPDVLPTIEEYSSLAFRISRTFSCKMASTRPWSPTANFQDNVRLTWWAMLSGKEYLLFKYLRAFFIVPVAGRTTVSFLHFWNIKHCKIL